MITDKRLQEYKKIYKEHYGKEISDAEALEQGTKLMRLMEVIYKPMTKREFNSIKRDMSQLPD